MNDMPNDWGRAKEPFRFSLATAFVGMMAAGALLGLFVSGVRSARDSARKMHCTNNLTMIGMALASYRSQWGRLPPACTFDAQGNPAHSWRLLIIPYLESTSFYSQYRFNEPWNGPNNRLLHDIAPVLYRCPCESTSNLKQSETSYVAVVGPQTAWSPDPSKPRPGEALLIVEVANSGIHWLEPRDWDVSEVIDLINSGAKGPSSLHPGGVLAARADGSIEFLPNTLTVEELRELIAPRDTSDDLP